MNRKSVTIAVLSAAFAAFGLNVAAADPITLTTLDEQVQLQGEFVGFAQDAYIVEINGSHLHVPVLLMTCEGVDCLDFQPRATAGDQS